MKFMEDGNAGYIRRELGVLNEAQILGEEVRPCYVTLIVRSLGKGFVELHIIMHIANRHCMGSA
jgi:hypothetical protein